MEGRRGYQPSAPPSHLTEQRKDAPADRDRTAVVATGYATRAGRNESRWESRLCSIMSMHAWIARRDGAGT